MTKITFKETVTSQGEVQYEASFVSTGEPVAIHIKRTCPGDLDFKTSIGDIPPVKMRNGGFSSREAKEVFFTTLPLVPEGVTVHIISSSLVEECNINITL